MFFFSNFLANCQSVSSVVPGVKGVVKRPAIFQWKVTRGNSSYRVGQLTAYNGSTSDPLKQLFSFSLKTKTIDRDQGISNRLNATILGTLNIDIEVIYQLILDSVRHDDVNTSFYLFALFSGPTAEQSGDEVELIEVNGTYSFFLCFLFLSCFVLFS